MFPNKPLVPATEDTNYQKQLEHLYARREVVDMLIATLEGYDRFRAHPLSDQNRKSA